jgi:putative heme-binding domain-containing protein
MLRCLAALALLAPAVQDAPGLKLEKGDRIAIVGNTLAERTQHDGWLETLLHARFPDLDLSFRNLGYSGDELTLRLRSSGFGSPEQWLARTGADVVFAFFGYNESFSGEAGLPKFRKDLEAFIKDTTGKTFGAKGKARLVLFSPIAHENLKSPRLPDGAANNARIASYATAMAELAKANGVPFVDLFGPTAKLYAASPRPLTINGVHLTEEGNRKLAEAVEQALFGAAPARETAALERLRQAVLDKNFNWFHRYRTTDGYSTYGGRADLRFVDGQTNRVVVQRELEILDVMTANRDARVWAVAKGGDLKVDDSNTPDFVPVKSNKPGPHLFLTGETEITRMQTAKGLKVNLYASEEQFPELANPVQMAWDTKGRLWVAAWPNYPHWRPKEPMCDKLVILEDADGDGRADRAKTFAGDLNNPTGFEFWNGGVLVAQCPDLLFLKDSDGDDKADIRQRVVHGLDSADTHHQSNSFTFDPGGALYFQEGTFHHSQVESPWGPPARLANAGVFRFEPLSHKFEVYVSYGFANPHGHVFDRWGQDFVTDGTGAETFYAPPFSVRTDFPRKHPKPPKVYNQRTRPCPGTEYLVSRHFPDEWQGNLLVANVIGFQGILRYRIDEKGSGYAGTEADVVVQSGDPNFRPSDLEIGPDGALYFTDWHNPIIGHMQHNLRDPSRDRTHGRVYRITYMDRPLLKPARIAGEPIERLLDLLKEPEDRVRYRAKIELSGRKPEEVVAAVRRWVDGLDKSAKDYEHHVLEALWVHQWHGAVDEALLKRVLRSPEPRARAAATRVLRAWRDRVPGVLDLLRAQANDEFPRVRLEALVAASYVEDPQAAVVALEVLKRERDEFIDFALKETMAALERFWKPALSEGKLALAPDNPAAAEYFLGNVSTAELAKLPKTPGVHLALLTRMGVALDARREALAGLAQARRADEVAVLLDVLAGAPLGAHAGHVVPDLAKLLFERPFKPSREKLASLARSANSPEARRLGLAAWIAADGSAEEAWTASSRTAEGTLDLLEAVPLVPDPALRASLYAKVRPLLFETPEAIRRPTPARALTVDYFETAPPDVAIETLAALKPQASGPFRELSLKAPQIRRRDAFALRFTGTLEVPKDGDYVFFTESDDGSRLYLDGKLVVNNDGLHGMAEKSGAAKLKAGIHALVVTYFDNGGGDGLVVSWQGPGLPKQPIPPRALGGASAADPVQDAAIRSAASFAGREKEVFEDLSTLIRTGRNRGAAFAAIRGIDRKHWPAEQARPLVDAILGWATSLPADQRTSPAALDALRFGHDVAALLPPDEAKKAQASLRTLDVNIIVLRPVPHQMIFDRRQIWVEAGKPAEILFDNVDIMPHNLVITAPGAMSEVGMAAERMGLEGQAKDFVPETPKILWATKLLLPGASQKLQFTAPAKTGAYPYVCTFPGHWLVMNGVMNVVEPGKLPETAEAPVEAASAAPARKFVKLWTLAELEPELKALESGRSLARGKEMFAAAGCAKCHTFAGEGSKLGPDLTKVTEKYRTGRDILRQILEPSTEINEQFKAQVFQTSDGDVLTGLVTKEDAQELHVVPNLLQPADVKVLPKSKIQARKPSDLSSMPTGLLVTLEKSEILDLLAYLLSGVK